GEVWVALPPGMSGAVRVTLEGRSAVTSVVQGNLLRLRLPEREPGRRRQPPAALARIAVRHWPGGPPAVGVVDLGDAVQPTWTRITAQEWVEAFARSRLAVEYGVPVRRITSARELAAALEAGPTAWFALVNPYGEGFPVEEPARWREMLDRVRAYVNAGGCWWETGGYSFYSAVSVVDGVKQAESVGPAGASVLGLPVGSGEVDQSEEPLRVPPEGRAWLGEALSTRVERAMSSVNRGLPRGSEDPGHVTLVAGAAHDFIGGYRLEGWGWLFRVGGFYPNPDVVLPVAVAAMEYLYTRPPLPVKPGGVRYLWHATVTPLAAPH
ncbi:MAG: hypothetical protein QHJ73_03725, partial [Armatimonadota bacterium]|nr:hypothetical protein [Armatimonadota bacterium]